MALATVTNRITDGSGHPMLGVPVYARLYPQTGAFMSVSGDEIVDSVDTVTDANGDWSMPLEKNPDMTPANSYWLVAEQIPQANGGPRLWQAIVTANTTLMAAAAAFLLPGPVLPNGLTVAAGDARYKLKSALWPDVKTDYGATGDGVTDDTAAINAAIADRLSAGSGVVYLPAPGQYKTTGPLTPITNPHVSFIMARGTALVPTGFAGHALTYRTDPFTVDTAGEVVAYIDCSNMLAGSIGFFSGDVVGLSGYIETYNAPAASVGQVVENELGWTEQWRVRQKSRYCPKGIRLNVAGGNVSFGYNEWDFTVVAGASQVGVEVAAGVLYSDSWRFVGNSDGNDTVMVDVLDGASLNGVVFNHRAEQTVGTGGINWRVAASAVVVGEGYLRSEAGLVNSVTAGGVLRVLQPEPWPLGGAEPTAVIGSFADWQGTGLTAEMVASLLQNHGNPYSHIGFISDNGNLRSPYVCLYDFGGNCFIVYKQEFDGTLVELWRVDNNGVVKAAGNQQKNIVTQTLSVNGAVTFDARSTDSALVTLDANCTSSTIVNAVTGQRLAITWLEGAAGGFTYAWPGNCKFAAADGSPPTPTATANKRDRQEFEFDGTNWWPVGRFVGNA